MRQHRSARLAPRVTGGLLVLALLVATALSVGVGARNIAPGVVLDALTSFDPTNVEHVIVSTRIPRTVMGIMAGIGLGLAGVAMQGVTRNPLADPGILGVNSGAALAVVVGLSVFGITLPVGVMALSLVGAALASAIVFLVSLLGGRSNANITMAIAGAAVTAASASIVGALLLLDEQALDAYRRWQVGSIATTNFETIIPAVPLMLLGLVLVFSQSSALNSLALGDDVAQGLGVRVTRARWIASIGFVILAGAATSMAGPIAFVGLAVPHMLRLLSGGEHKTLMPLSCLAGALMVLVADVLGRVIAPPGEVAAGVLTAVLGAPVLMWLARSRKGLSG